MITRGMTSVGVWLALAGTSVTPPDRLNAPRNGGFETIEPEKPERPADWQVDGEPSGYAVDTRVRRHGRRALHVIFREDGNGPGYAGAIQRFSAAGLGGKRLRFSAQFRRTNPASKVGLFVLFDDGEGKRLLYLNSYEQAAKMGSGWSKQLLTLVVPRTASSAALGVAIHEADGEMWVDDVELSVSEK